MCLCFSLWWLSFIVWKLLLQAARLFTWGFQLHCPLVKQLNYTSAWWELNSWCSGYCTYKEKERGNPRKLFTCALLWWTWSPSLTFWLQVGEVRLICIWTPVRGRVWEASYYFRSHKRETALWNICLLVCVATNKNAWITNWR